MRYAFGENGLELELKTQSDFDKVMMENSLARVKAELDALSKDPEEIARKARKAEIKEMHEKHMVELAYQSKMESEASRLYQGTMRSSK